MFMEEKQNSQTFQDFNQSIFNPSTREEIVEIIRDCYKKNIPLEINGAKSKNKTPPTKHPNKKINKSNIKLMTIIFSAKLVYFVHYLIF